MSEEPKVACTILALAPLIAIFWPPAADCDCVSEWTAEQQQSCHHSLCHLCNIIADCCLALLHNLQAWQILPQAQTHLSVEKSLHHTLAALHPHLDEQLP